MRRTPGRLRLGLSLLLSAFLHLLLWPTGWRRTEDRARRLRPSFATILLSVAFNGEEPSRQPPEME